LKTVLYVTNIPSPYRVEFFTLLAESVKLTVIYERRTAANREKSWMAKTGAHRFEEIFLDGKSFGEEFSLSLGLVRHLRKHRYDDVVFGGYNSPTVILAMRWMRRHKLPYGITIDGMLPKDAVGPGWKERLKRSLISNAEFFLSSGHITTGELIKYGAKPEQIYETPFSSVRESDILPSPPERETYKTRLGCSGKTVLLYVGQFIHRKGIDLLLPAFEQYCREAQDPDARLYLVGGREDQLHGLGIESLPENIICVPFLTKAELADYYRATDLLVLPTREDIWGLVVNEAMSYGTPVLTTDHCVCGLELVEPGKTGVLVPAGDAAALAVGIRDGLAITDREAVLERARAYTIDEMYRQTLLVLESVASRQ
jgi:glycosyltransferase involved in cell wall biosynthesis